MVGLLVAFALLVAVYLGVVNRRVPFALQVHAPEVVYRGQSVVLRATVYRPDRHEVLTGAGQLQLEPDVRNIALPLRTGELAHAVFRVPAEAGDELHFTFSASLAGEPDRRLAFSLPVADPPAPYSGLSASDPVDVGPLGERPRVQLLRREAADPGIDLRMVAGGGVPVRFQDNRFILRVADAEGRPLVGAMVRVAVQDGPSFDLTTDALGLAEAAFTPQDLTIWRVTVTANGADAVYLFEVVPSFDGAVMSVPAFVSSTEPVTAQLRSGGGRRAFFDIAYGQTVLATLQQPTSAAILLHPPTGRWPDGLLWLQSYSNGFSAAPQSAVRCVWVRPAGTPAAETARVVAGAMAAAQRDGTYFGALRDGPELDHASAEQRMRLTRYACAVTRPPFTSLSRRVDDQNVQVEALAAETQRFRRKAHVLLGLGTFALIAWLFGRVGFLMWRTRKRTREVLAALDDPEWALMAGFGANAGAGALVWLTVVSLTIAAFCLGVIALLANM